MPSIGQHFCVPVPTICCSGQSHPLFSPNSLEIKELEEVILHKPGAAQKQALDLLEIHVPNDRLHGCMI